MGKRNSDKGKLVIKFNPQKRKEYLTGFKKRKDERRAIAKQEIKEEERKQKAEFRYEKKKYKESINEQYETIKEAFKQINKDY